MAEQSREKRKGRAIRRLRWVVLAATVGVVTAVTGFYLAGRREPPEPVADPGTEELEPTGELVTVGEGFERTFTEGDRPVFTVRGERYAVDRSGIVSLEGVEITVFQEDGSAYEVTGAEAEFDVEEREGRLTGGVRISTPAGVEATMEELWVRDRGRLLASQGPERGRVHLFLGDAYEGTAEKLWVAPHRRLVHLRDDVDVRGVAGAAAGFRLRGENVILDLSRNTVEASGAAILRRPGEIVRARRIVAFLEEETHEVRFVRARWDVWARLNSRGTLGEMGPAEEATDEGDGLDLSRLIVECEDLGLLLGSGGRQVQEAEIQDGPRGIATLTAIDAGDTVRHVLKAPRITADLEDGRPVRAEAEGGVVLSAVERTEEPVAGDGPPAIREDERRATAERAVAGFGPAGDLRSVELTGGVTLTQGSLEATGARGVFHPAEDRGELLGDVVVTDEGLEATGERGVFDLREDSGELSGRPAVVVGEQGRMEGPTVTYDRAEGLVHGSGGVRARLDRAEDSPLGGTPLGSTRRGPDGEAVPLRVEAEEGFFRDRPRAFLFRGSVRAWRGDDLLLADSLRGDEAEGRLTATGDVRTLFVPEEGGARDGEPEGGDGGAGEPGLGAPLEVEAEELVYHRRERLLVYTGEVVAEQEGRTVSCRTMDVTLAEGGGIDELVCTGDVRVIEPEEGRTLAGERAVYRPEERTVVVEAGEGGRVVLRDRQGNEIDGLRMEYDLDSGQVRVTGPDGSAGTPDAAPAPTPADPGDPREEGGP